MGKRIQQPELITSFPMKPDEVAAYRKWFGPNMKVLGSMLGGVPARTIGRWERGDAIVTNDLAEKIRSLLYPRGGEPKLSANDPEYKPRPVAKRRCVYTIEIKVFEEPNP